MSTETTFSNDIGDADILKDRLWPLCEKISSRLKEKDIAGTTVTLKLKTSKFRTVSRSHSLPAPTQLAETLYRTGTALLERALGNAPAATAYRLIGIGVSGLQSDQGADPLDLADPDARQRKQVEAVIDEVRSKLGRTAIGKGRGFRNQQ